MSVMRIAKVSAESANHDEQAEEPGQYVWPLEAFAAFRILCIVAPVRTSSMRHLLCSRHRSPSQCPIRGAAREGGLPHLRRLRPRHTKAPGSRSTRSVLVESQCCPMSEYRLNA